MKRIVRRASSLALALLLIASLTVPALAAKTKDYSVTSDGTQMISMTIKTDKATTLKFTQTKGKISYQNMATGTSSLKTYGDFFVYVKDNSGKEAPKSYNCYQKASISIKLSKNKTYTVTVCPSAKFVTYNRLVDSGKLWYKAPWETTFKWTSVPVWTLSAKKIVTMDVIKQMDAPQQ